MTFRFLTPALAEIREAAEYYDERVSGLGPQNIRALWEEHEASRNEESTQTYANVEPE